MPSLGDRSVFAVINPAAGRGRGARRVDHFLSLLAAELPGFAHALTTKAGDERRLTDRAIREGYETIVAVGGDGTWSAAADRIVAAGRPGVRLALLAGGTGNDFGKTFGITFERSREVLRAVREGRTRRIDVGRVHSGGGADGARGGGAEEGARTFLNVVGMGFDIAVIRDAERFPILKGDALYKFCALRQLFRFPGVSLEITGDFEPELSGSFLMVVVANARYFGGSFLIAPEARLDDAHLDLVAIRDAGPARRARLFGLVAGGRHAGQPGVHVVPSRRVSIAFPAPLSYEVDGEVLDAAGPLTIESLPSALELVVPGT